MTKPTIRNVRRSLVAVAGMVVALVPTACWPQLPPGPVLTEVTLSPSPVAAGSTFTLSVTATSSSGQVSSISLVVRTPSGGYLPRTPSCEQGHGPSGPAAPERTASWSCAIPAEAPNGTWVAEVRAFDQGYGVTAVDVPFEVTGGSNDTQGPQAILTIPSTVARGSSFSFTVRASDEHPGDFFRIGDVMVLQQNASLGPNRFSCDPGVWTPIDATTSEFTATCSVPAGQSPGDYHTYGLELFDAFGQTSLLDITTTVV